MPRVVADARAEPARPSSRESSARAACRRLAREGIEREEAESRRGGWPRALQLQVGVERTLQDGSLAEGVVSKMWVHFMRRPFDGGKADTEIRRQLVYRFMESGYDIKALVKAIVTHPTYRRIR